MKIDILWGYIYEYALHGTSRYVYTHVWIQTDVHFHYRLSHLSTSFNSCFIIGFRDLDCSVFPYIYTAGTVLYQVSS